LVGLNPDKLRYELVFAGTGVTYEKLAEARRFVQEPERAYEADLTTARRLKDLILKADGRPVRKIILFGSRARGDARADSDFDLLVVVPGITPSEKRAAPTAAIFLAYLEAPLPRVLAPKRASAPAPMTPAFHAAWEALALVP
jgi:predicted nucleotidyltransferase